MSKLEAYKAQVDRLLNEGVWNAVVILRELQAVGYTGGYTILREYIAPKRVMRSGRRTVRFETPARQHLQSDWGEINTLIDGTETKVYFIVNELWPTRDAFIFGARRVWMPSTPTKRWGRRGADLWIYRIYPHPSTAQFQARFVDLAAACGFTFRVCRHIVPHQWQRRTDGRLYQTALLCALPGV